jgi:CO dehydrogenase maturation factor
MSDFDFLGFIPFEDAMIEADLEGVSPFEKSTLARSVVKELIGKL